MKFGIALILASLAFCCASARPTYKTIRVGVKGGMNISNYTFDRTDIGENAVGRVPGSKFGYQAGVVFRLTIPGFIHIQPEINFIERNYDFRLIRTSYYGKVSMSARRIELPLTVGFDISVVRIFGGAVFNLAEWRRSNVSSSVFDVKFKKSHVDMLLGLGLDIRKFFLDVRYIVPTGSSHEDVSIMGITQRTHVRSDELWEISAGFFF